jgi:hypothetical protein
MTFRSTSVHDQIEFSEGPILFIGDLGQLSLRFTFAQCLSSIGSLHDFLIGHQFDNFQLQQPMRGEDPSWYSVLLSIVDDQTHNSWD